MMLRRTYTLNGLNREALDEQLTQALGGVYAGFADQESPAGYVVTVLLNPAATAGHIDELNALMADYDPQRLSTRQQAQQTRQQRLTAARRDYRGDDLLPADYAAENTLIQNLARKVAWLEQEIADLRGE
jgi:hypothetical protein